MSLQTEIKPLTQLPMASSRQAADQPCCGGPADPPSKSYERPGFTVCSFVDDFLSSPIGLLPKVTTQLCFRDQVGMIRVRLGIRRNSYKIAPGLYCVGNPDQNSPVLVTANYKLTFDSLRKELDGINCFILALDTRGINVWCAAGKKTFSTAEIVRQVNRTDLPRLVSHRELIVPQLGAPGVSALQVKKQCGFKVVYGPIRAADLPEFLRQGKKTTDRMRQVTFTLRERLGLIPLELALIIRPSLMILVLLFILSGIGREIFSFQQAWSRGLLGSAFYGLGVFTGAVVVPALLPWIPGRSFYLKGLLSAAIGLIPAIFLVFTSISASEAVSLIFGALTISSYCAMNFTGATPFTSPSGVEKEMRRGIPIQAVSLLISLIVWVSAPFLR